MGLFGNKKRSFEDRQRDNQARLFNGYIDILNTYGDVQIIDRDSGDVIAFKTPLNKVIVYFKEYQSEELGVSYISMFRDESGNLALTYDGIATYNGVKYDTQLTTIQLLSVLRYTTIKDYVEQLKNTKKIKPVVSLNY